MPIAQDFLYERPNSLNAALEILSQFGSDAVPLAGGTDLLVWLKDDKVKPKYIVDIKQIDELKILEKRGTELFIGAAVTFAEIYASPIIAEEAPLLAEAAATVASVGVRNRATLVGNIVSAVPCLDSAPALLVYEAKVQVRSKFGERQIPIGEWFVGPRKTALRADEMVTGVVVPLYTGKVGSCYAKLGRYRGEDLAQAGFAVLVLPGNEYRVAHCALGPIPRRCAGVEALLRGHTPGEIEQSVLAKAKLKVVEEIAPISDVRASKEYRTHMAGVMLERAWRLAEARADGRQLCHCQILGG